MPAPTTGCKLTNYHKAYLPVQCDILCNCCSSVPLTHIFISSSRRSTTQEIIRHKTKQKIIVRLSFYNIFSVWVWLWNAFLTQSRLDEQMNKHGGQNPENITSLPTMSGSVKAPQNAREKSVRFFCRGAFGYQVLDNGHRHALGAQNIHPTSLCSQGHGNTHERGQSAWAERVDNAGAALWWSKGVK